MNLPPAIDWWYSRPRALEYARVNRWVIHDISDPSNTTTPGQVFHTVASKDGHVWMLTADVQKSGKPRWWWVHGHLCDHLDHDWQPYPLESQAQR
jgi:hypothetical protein